MWWITAALGVEVEVGPGLAFESIQAAIDGTGPEPLLIRLAPGEFTDFDPPPDRVVRIVGRGRERTVIRITAPLSVEANSLATRLGLGDLALTGNGTDALLEVSGEGAVRATVELDGARITGGSVRQVGDEFGTTWERDAPIEVQTGGLLVAKRTEFVGNSGPRGGHIAVLGGELRLIDATLRDGVGHELGGAVYVDAGLAHVTGTRIADHIAPTGSAFHIDGDGSLILVGGDVDGNTSTGTGAVTLDGGSLSVLGGRFGGNVGSEGGAIYANGDTRVEGVLFAENSATSRGGAVVCRGTCELLDNRFVANAAPEGAAFVLDGVDGRHTRNAVCRSVGNAVSLRSANTELTSSLFWANEGDPVRVDGGSVDLRHVVFGDNLGDGAAAIHQRSGRVVLSDSLLAWNGDLSDTTPGSALLVRADEPADVTLSFVATFQNGVENSPGIASLGARLVADPLVHTVPAAVGGPGRICALSDWKLEAGSPLVGAASTPGVDLGIHAGDDSPADRVDADDDGLLAPYDCDDDDAAALGPIRVWPNDGDSDGHASSGDPGTTFQACPGPSGRAPASDDCDDRDRLTFPGAWEDLQGDDRDCDGWLDPAQRLERACRTGPSSTWLALPLLAWLIRPRSRTFA